MIPPDFFVPFTRRNNQVSQYSLRTAFFQPREFRPDDPDQDNIVGDIGKYFYRYYTPLLVVRGGLSNPSYGDIGI